MMSDVLVIIPTYNEIENIGNIIDAVMALPDRFDILVIDDASPDGTQDAVQKKMTEYPDRVHMETRSGKLGLGTAYIHGFRWAIDKGYDFVIEMDADFSHNPNDLPRLYKECKENGADVSISILEKIIVNISSKVKIYSIKTDDCWENGEYSISTM